MTQDQKQELIKLIEVYVSSSIEDSLAGEFMMPMRKKIEKLNREAKDNLYQFIDKISFYY